MTQSFNNHYDTDRVINRLIDWGLQREADNAPRRNYLGASLLGDDCDRRIQYRYQGVQRDPSPMNQSETQLLRFFAMGNCLEPMIIQWMENAGFILSTRNAEGKQHGFTQAGGKIAGHIDGVLLGCKVEIFGDSFDYPALWECKTMGASQWRKFIKYGLHYSHPHYVAQVQLYMAYMGLTENPALLTALNKDTAQLHHEFIEFDAQSAQHYSDRAVKLLKALEAGETLPRIAHSEDYFVCKSCPFHERCWSLSRRTA